MEFSENIGSLRTTLAILRAEERRLVGLMALPRHPVDLRDRIQANLELMRQVSERLSELERGRLAGNSPPSVTAIRNL
jgi:hypothetical protein